MAYFCKNCNTDVHLRFDGGTGVQRCVVCNNEIISAFLLPPKTILGGFCIEEVLKFDEMGTIYRAEQLNLQRFVSLKVLPLSLANDIDFVERFFEEARLTSELMHKNILKVYNAGVTPDGIYFIATELLEGKSLRDELFINKTLSEIQVFNIVKQSINALNYAWDTQKVLHPYLYLDNIFIQEDGNTKIEGIGVPLKQNISNFDNSYTAPEIIKNNTDATVASNLFSIGATAYHLLVGHPPALEQNIEITSQMPRSSWIEIDSNASQQFSDFIEKLLSINPRERFISWRNAKNTVNNIKLKKGVKKVFHIQKPSETMKRITTSLTRFEDYKKNPSLKNLLILLIIIIITLISGILAINFELIDLNNMPWDQVKRKKEILTEWNIQKKRIPFAASTQNALKIINDFKKKYSEWENADLMRTEVKLLKKLDQEEVLRQQQNK